MFRATDKPIVEKPDDVTAVLAVFTAMPKIEPRDQPTRRMADELERIRRSYVFHPDSDAIKVPINATTFGWLGCLAFDELTRHHPTNSWGKEFTELLVRKHQKYGAHPLRVWGPLGIIIRIHSKFERYQNIKDDPNALLLDEGAIDTIQDILGYCILGYLMCKE